AAWLRRAGELARGQGSAHTLAEIERDLGAALEANGDAPGARAARERAIALYRGLGAAAAAADIAALIERKPQMKKAAHPARRLPPPSPQSASQCPPS